MTRILTALVGIPALVAVIRYLPPVWFLGVALLSVIVGTLEFFSLAGRSGTRPHRILGTLLGVAILYSFFSPEVVPHALVLAAAAILVPLRSLIRAWREPGGGPDDEFQAVAVTLAGVIGVGFLMGYTVGLLGDGGERGRDLIVLLFWTVWISDSAAWACGKLLGRHKLFPGVSPGKTLEGAAGALMFGVLAAFGARAWFFPDLSGGDALVLGLLLSLSGMAGDLSESLLKRAAGMKDSGGLFPGHGGMLDRTDSLLFAAPVLFYYHEYFLT